MRILVVGGTRFVGRFLVAEAITRGHEVTVLHRGVGCDGAPGVQHLHADRDDDLSVLATGQWDATVDTCAYWPRQVTSLAAALGDRGGRHLLISTVSVYADAPRPGLDEDAPLQDAQGLSGPEPAMSPAVYGPLKVGCEQVARERHGGGATGGAAGGPAGGAGESSGGLLIVRPTFVVGPHDYTGRFPYWVDRVARGGQVLVPGRPDAPFQYVDVRDLAAFCLHLLEAGEEGTFHAISATPPFGWGDLVDALLATVAPAGTTVRWVPSDRLAERGVTPADLPLWTGSDDPEYVLAMDPSRALAAGLRPRPLPDTIRDTLAWLREPDSASTLPGSFLSADREVELLSAGA